MNARQLRTTIIDGGTLELALHEVDVPGPGDDEVVVRMEATPVNPSDLGQMLAGGDPSTARTVGEGADRKLVLDISPEMTAFMTARGGTSFPLGNEGAGVVVAAGASRLAQSLLGKTVAVFGRGTITELRPTPATECLVLPEGVTPAQGAACFVNPLTALAMVETMRLDGHHGLVHTAAASQLGQMLVRLCRTDDVPLVNIVRRPDQVDLLRGLGATHVVDSSGADFHERLVEALVVTDATLAFDAVGGGPLASDILTAMETAQGRNPDGIAGYGSMTHKQLYVYGGLDRSPLVIQRRFGPAWGIGGFLLPMFLDRVGADEVRRLRARVASEITTTFATSYTAELSMEELLTPGTLGEISLLRTGQKHLLLPNR